MFSGPVDHSVQQSASPGMSPDPVITRRASSWFMLGQWIRSSSAMLSGGRKGGKYSGAFQVPRTGLRRQRRFSSPAQETVKKFPRAQPGGVMAAFIAVPQQQEGEHSFKHQPADFGLLRSCRTFGIQGLERKARIFIFQADAYGSAFELVIIHVDKQGKLVLRMGKAGDTFVFSICLFLSDEKKSRQGLATVQKRF